MLRSEILDGRAEPSILLLDTAPARGPLPQAWSGLLKHLLLVLVIAALGALLGKLPAFRETQMLEGRISAAMLAQLLGAIGAIGFFWLLGRGVASRFRAGGGPRAVLYDLSMPIVTLLCLLIGYLVLQRPLAPVWDEAVTSIYTWCFVLGTCACAIWLSMAVFSHAEALRKLLHDYHRAAKPAVDQSASAWAGPKEK
jgi:small-conductance mechanosensitive channel